MDADSHSPLPGFPLEVHEIRIDNIQIEKQLRVSSSSIGCPCYSNARLVGFDGDHGEKSFWIATIA